MKSQVSPVAMIACIVLVLVIAVAIGVRSLSPPPAAPKAAAEPAMMMNGQKVPAGAPLEYLKQSIAKGQIPANKMGGMSPGMTMPHP